MSSQDLLSVCETIWDNWKNPNPENTPCDGCPAHWTEREDYHPNQQGAIGHSPYFGHGELTDIDVVILGEEPGGDKRKAGATDWSKKEFKDKRKPDIKDAFRGANTLEWVLPLIDELDRSHSVYFTQIKKCQEMDDSSKNNEAQIRCAGIDEFSNQGYLKTELKTADPKYVIGLGMSVCSRFQSLYEMETIDLDDFTPEIATGESRMRLRRLNVRNQQFKFIPMPHPNGGIHKYTREKLNEDWPSGLRDQSEKYFGLAGEDVVEFLS